MANEPNVCLAKVISVLHQRFPDIFSVRLIANLQAALQPPSKGFFATATPEQRDKDESARVLRQRGLLRIFAELELVGVIRPDKKGSLGDATFAIFRDLVRTDGILSSVPS